MTREEFCFRWIKNSNRKCDRTDWKAKYVWKIAKKTVVKITRRDENKKDKNARETLPDEIKQPEKTALAIRCMWNVDYRRTCTEYQPYIVRSTKSSQEHLTWWCGAGGLLFCFSNLPVSDVQIRVSTRKICGWFRKRTILFSSVCHIFILNIISLFGSVAILFFVVCDLFKSAIEKSRTIFRLSLLCMWMVVVRRAKKEKKRIVNDIVELSIVIYHFVRW